MAELPLDARPYRRTPIHDEATIPAGLRREHRTRTGVWGLISVVDGRLWFRRLAPRREITLAAGDTAVVAPEEPHEVEPDGPVRFFVEFYQAA